jgi:hypothetical protein
MNTSPIPSPPDLPARLRKVRLRRLEAVEYLAVVHGIEISPRTLGKWGGLGKGPPFGKMHSTVFYERAEIDRWVAETLRPGGQFQGQPSHYSAAGRT